jgi:hypothetical protein
MYTIPDHPSKYWDDRNLLPLQLTFHETADFKQAAIAK